MLKINENDIKEMVLETIKKYIKQKSHHIHEIKYFHPTGKSLPNGSNYQKGGFLKECEINKNSFVLSEGVHGEQYGLRNYRGGIIVFAVTINSIKLSDNEFINKIKQFIETLKQTFNKDRMIHNTITDFNNDKENNSGEYIGAYSLGNFFKGKYLGDNGEMYNDRSICIEINGLSSKSLLKLGEKLCTKFKQETVLIKDLNRNKIYLADAIPSDSTFESDINNVNIKC